MQTFAIYSILDISYNQFMQEWSLLYTNTIHFYAYIFNVAVWSIHIPAQSNLDLCSFCQWRKQSQDSCCVQGKLPIMINTENIFLQEHWQDHTCIYIVRISHREASYSPQIPNISGSFVHRCLWHCRSQWQHWWQSILNRNEAFPAVIVVFQDLHKGVGSTSEVQRPIHTTPI